MFCQSTPMAIASATEIGPKQRVKYLQVRFNATEAARGYRSLQEKRVHDALIVHMVRQAFHVHRAQFLAPVHFDRSGETAGENERQPNSVCLRYSRTIRGSSWCFESCSRTLLSVERCERSVRSRLCCLSLELLALPQKQQMTVSGTQDA
jgi:hypothetical protein